MPYVNPELAAYLATLQVGDTVSVSSGSSVYRKTIARMTKTLFVMEKPQGSTYERRFRRDNGLDFEGGTASWRRDCIITPEAAASRVAAREREAKVRKVNAIVGGLNLPRGADKATVLQALADATALVEEML